MSLTGYVRPDGRVGFRNYLVVLPLVGCVGDIARRIADRADGAVPIVHPHGCELQATDSVWLALQMEGLALHPNVGGVLLVTMSCGATNQYRLADKAAEAGKLVETVNFHRAGGTHKSVQLGGDLAEKMLERLGKTEREPVDISALVLGTKCGSSDRTSFDVLHDVTGVACDRIVDAGGTVVLAENFELVADIETLAERGVDERVKADILGIKDPLLRSYEARVGTGLELGEEAKAASFKHAAKAGTRPIQRVIPLAGRIEGPGLVVHDAPNSDLVSVTTLAVAGCNMVLFTTGRGTPVGGPCVPTVKVTANPRTQEHMAENIDVGVGEVTEGKMSAEQGAERIYDATLRIANGELSKSERLKHFEMQFCIQGVTF